MKYLFIILFYSTFLSIFSFEHNKPKLCINCKYFIKNIHNDNDNDNEFGKCSLFPRVEEDNEFLVTGIHKNKNINYYYASTARSTNMCGKEGKMYKRKYVKKGNLKN